MDTSVRLRTRLTLFAHICAEDSGLLYLCDVLMTTRIQYSRSKRKRANLTHLLFTNESENRFGSKFS